jgi:hypothetical protein
MAVRLTAGLAVCQGPSAQSSTRIVRGTDWQSVDGRPTPTFVRMRGCPNASGQRLSDMIFPKNVQSDNSGGE